MNFGKDFFRILNFAIALIRLFGKIFGDEDTKTEIKESEDRTVDSDPNHTM